MKVSIKSKQFRSIKVCGKEYKVEVIEMPFREGVELRCFLDDEELRVSDRQLGEKDALRILAEQIKKRISGES